MQHYRYKNIEYAYKQVLTSDRPINMPICEICGMEVTEVHNCKDCEAKFCDECGNIKERLCYDCIGWEENELDNEDWNDQVLN